MATPDDISTVRAINIHRGAHEGGAVVWQQRTRGERSMSWGDAMNGAIFDEAGYRRTTESDWDLGGRADHVQRFTVDARGLIVMSEADSDDDGWSTHAR